MGLDFSSLSPAARAIFIKDGEQFGSEDTLEQANLTLNAYAIHGAKLNDYGFSAEDAQELHMKMHDGLMPLQLENSMKKKIVVLVIASAGIFGLFATPQSADAGDPCFRKEFKTTMIKDACTKAG